jgi:hypothetical protein
VRKNCYLLVILCALAVACHGQENLFIQEGQDPKTFTGALLLGLNFSQVDGDSYYGYHKVGLNTGAQVMAHITNNFGISMELLYSRKGSRAVVVTESAALGTYIWKYYMDVNYIEVPLLMHFMTRKYDIELGASYARLINSNEYVISDQPVIISPDANRFNTSDVDFTLGLTRKLYKKLFVNMRYQYSLTSIRPIERIPIGYSYGNKGQFNNLFNLRLEYAF